MLSCAFNWDMWRIVFIEAAFGLALAIAGVEAASAWLRRQRAEALLYAVVLAVMVGTQAAFLIHGASMHRQWDATEARELFIAAGLGLYGLQLALMRGSAEARSSR
jgi:hypothetical protein